jgi:hypothetical protein
MYIGYYSISYMSKGRCVRDLVVLRVGWSQCAGSCNRRGTTIFRFLNWRNRSSKLPALTCVRGFRTSHAYTSSMHRYDLPQMTSAPDTLQLFVTPSKRYGHLYNHCCRPCRIDTIYVPHYNVFRLKHFSICKHLTRQKEQLICASKKCNISADYQLCQQYNLWQ